MSKRIESDKLTINCAPEKVYDFIGDFDNFTALLPDKVENWQSTGDSCTFEVKGLATLGLRITGKIPFTQVNMKGEGKLPFNFTISTLIQETPPNHCLVQMVVDTDMNQFIAMMAQGPLQNFIDQLVSRLKIEMEK
jgi:carbon monoxide dehydrogenase subunit G